MKKDFEIIPEDVESCSIYKIMELFQKKWTVWVLFELNKNNSLRFGELKKSIPGISNTMLTSTLKYLEEKELLERIQFNEIPPRVEYTLTEKAKALYMVFDAMKEWGDRYL